MADQSDDSGEDFGTIPVDPKQSTSDNATKLTGSQKISKGKAFDIAHFFTVVTHDNIRKNTLSLERPRKYPKGCPNTT